MKYDFSKMAAMGLLAAMIVSCAPANAGFANGDSVTMGGASVFEMADAGGFTGKHRAWLAQDALDNALVLAGSLSPSAVTVGRENGAVIISLDGRRFATVDGNSADQASLTVDQLADKWSNSVKGFLSDTGRTNTYVASLRDGHRVESTVVKVERTMYAPAGMSFQVKLSKALNGQTIKNGDLVEGTVSSDVPLGRYVIPAGSIVSGVVVEGEQDNFGIRFISIKGTDGRVYPIESIITDQFVFTSQGAHNVCTYAIPSGMANGVPLVAGRIPANIGVGTREGSETNALVFHKNTADSFIAGKILFLQLETTAPIAVVISDKVM